MRVWPDEGKSRAWDLNVSPAPPALPALRALPALPALRALPDVDMCSTGSPPSKLPGRGPAEQNQLLVYGLCHPWGSS